MKKLYRKGTVHPSPPPPVSDYLSFLPAAILTLALSLSSEDREVLAYLISCSTHRGNTQNAPERDHRHSPAFTCDCFGCYTSYWARWDTSPNRQLIHEIIDAFEDGLAADQRREKGARREKKRRRRGARVVAESTRSESDLSGPDSVGEASGTGGGAEAEEGGGDDVAAEGVDEKGSVRKFVSFIGEKFWGVWT